MVAAWLAVALTTIAGAADPLVGVWQLDHQELNGQKKESEQLTLRISPDGDKYSFAFAVPVNNIDFVSLTYSAKPDGTEAEIKNARGEKVGTVQLTTSTHLHYKLLMKGTNRPDTTVLLTVSADNKTLTSESDSNQSSSNQPSSNQASHPARLVQTFFRH